VLCHVDEVDASSGWYYNFEYGCERHRGLDFQERLFSPWVFRFAARGTPVIIASTESQNATVAELLRAAMEDVHGLRPATALAAAT
jgi:hypothetical protein